MASLFVVLAFSAGCAGNGQESNSNAEAASAEAITLISKGEAVDIAEHIPDSGTVLVEFTADW